MPVEDTFAEVKTRFTGEHRWPNAPDEVAFLRDYHRHEFHVEVSVEQTHNDRDVEYIMMKRALDDFLSEWPQKLGSKSCEMMAEDIIEDFLVPNYGDERRYGVSVIEDGENGALVSRQP
jgi:hypothetical protein